MKLVSGLLRRRIRADGASPLITYYEVGAGERVELSALTFANWVAKASNLLAWELSVAPGDPVAMPLAQSDARALDHRGLGRSRSGRSGAYVDLSASDGQHQAAVLVCGPDWRTVRRRLAPMSWPARCTRSRPVSAPPRWVRPGWRRR